MSEKKFTVAEANALLPYLAPTLVELREKFEAAERIRGLVAQAATTNGGSTERDKWSRTMERVSELLERLEEWGVALRDVGTGLVDFPGEVAGEPAWLCWRLGEPEVGYWHGDDGFSGRRPL
ncbi:MAG TPA: DUF2203 domain-containing protein [Actinomycetota bacterium]|jgi:hypothetical protein